MTSNVKVRHRSRPITPPVSSGSTEGDADSEWPTGDSPEEYEVGYKKPPKESQFQPGQSGNPKGRSKGSQNTRTLIVRELDATITIRENGTRQTTTKREVVAKRVVNKAVDGDPKTLFSRLNDKQTGRIIAIQQRLHEDDLAAYLMDKGNFEHLNLCAIAEEDEVIEIGLGSIHTRHKGEPLFPEREPLDTLEGICRDIGAYAFSAQYQQNPVPPEGNRIRWEWFDTYDEHPPRTYFQMVVQSWDTAVTAEPTAHFSVCTTWGYREGKWYLLDLFRDRLDYGPLKRKIIDLRDRWRADQVIVEYAATGIPLLREFRNEDLGLLQAYKPAVDKETRVAAQTAKLETGDYLVPQAAEWIPAFKQELLAFPNGRHDDQVDSMTQFLDWIGSRHGKSIREWHLNGGRPPGRRRRRR